MEQYKSTAIDIGKDNIEAIYIVLIRMIVVNKGKAVFILSKFIALKSAIKENRSFSESIFFNVCPKFWISYDINAYELFILGQ